MKKILIATGVYPPESGGPATYAKLLEEYLPAHGFQVAVLPFREVRHLPKLVRHIAYFFKVLRAPADVIYALDTVSVGLPAALAAWLRGKKFLLRVPGDYAWEQGQRRFGVRVDLDEFQHKVYGPVVETLRAVQRFVARRAAAVVVPSEYMKKIVSGWTNAAKIHRIYSSVALPETAAVSRPEGFLVVSSGRRVSWKHFDAIERVVARESGWQFFLASDLPRKEALGWVKAADVYALNSTYEGLSHALVEAMLLGTPVVATRVGGTPELIEDGVDGLLIPAGDEDALHAALKRVADNKEEARARAEAARTKTKKFSITVAVDELAKILNSL